MSHYLTSLIVLVVIIAAAGYGAKELEREMKREYTNAESKTIDKDDVDLRYSQAVADVKTMKISPVPKILNTIDPVWLDAQRSLGKIVDKGWKLGLNVGENKLKNYEGNKYPFVQVIGSPSQVFQWQGTVEYAAPLIVMEETVVKPMEDQKNKVMLSATMNLVKLEDK